MVLKQVHPGGPHRRPQRLYDLVIDLLGSCCRQQPLLDLDNRPQRRLQLALGCHILEHDSSQ
jgi:hypothetical protein